MTNEEILKLAKEAGFCGVDEWFKAALPRFVVIVGKAQEIEREACAKEAERMVMYPGGRCESPAHSNVWDAAKAIRSRGNKG
jgi:hypothetical protein